MDESSIYRDAFQGISAIVTTVRFVVATQSTLVTSLAGARVPVLPLSSLALGNPCPPRPTSYPRSAVRHQDWRRRRRGGAHHTALRCSTPPTSPRETSFLPTQSVCIPRKGLRRGILNVRHSGRIGSQGMSPTPPHCSPASTCQRLPLSMRLTPVWKMLQKSV